MDIYDHSWTFDERRSDQYKHFVLIGSKGMTQAYPTGDLKHPEQFYSREEALANAALAAKAPDMLRLLRSAEKSLEILSVDDVGALRLLQDVQQGLSGIVSKVMVSA
ncbi:hypothetical protein [Tardiphaga sp. P9-11]|uniref:hypothetical protein n=1 Tax=Tardiphaga sp. P9-11 TaxID=2024614 RepID=UPI0011F28B33|nr:hypothetical protein [Tardiphaga sp. P9-11]KAA0076128.1 hypothetical protein CIW50_07655 [Tardiphaga sp. P9-11]